MAAAFRSLSGLCARVVVGLAALAAAPAHAGEETFDPMSDGSDGALVVDANTVINLALAPTGSWMDPAPEPGLGVYDPSIWAVVFKYESVSINAGTVSFLNHPSGAPVVWLVEGEVVVAAAGVVSLNGAAGVTSVDSIPGPGAFAGGRVNPPTAGFGPGGSTINSDPGASHAAGLLPYGNTSIVPLMGGSGGGCGTNTNGGGAGGGAILITGAAIEVSGVVRARGGNGGGGAGNWGGSGSGGAIRLVAESISVIGSDRLDVSGGGGGDPGSAGRIRLEANSFNVDGASPEPPTFPYYTTARPGPLFQDEATPYLRVASINGIAVPEDPLGGVQSIDAGIQDTNSTITLEIHAWNIEPGSIIEVRAQQAQGNHIVVQSAPLEGGIVFSTATAEISLNSGIPADIVLRVLP